MSLSSLVFEPTKTYPVRECVWIAARICPSASLPPSAMTRWNSSTIRPTGRFLGWPRASFSSPFSASVRGTVGYARGIDSIWRSSYCLRDCNPAPAADFGKNRRTCSPARLTHSRGDVRAAPVTIPVTSESSDGETLRIQPQHNRRLRRQPVRSGLQNRGLAKAPRPEQKQPAAFAHCLLDGGHLVCSISQGSEAKLAPKLKRVIHVARKCHTKLYHTICYHTEQYHA